MSTDISKAVMTTESVLPEHYATLLGERKAGSTWGRDFVESDFELPWVEDTANVHASVKMARCQYFKVDDVHLHFPDAQVRVMKLSDIHPDLVKEVETQEGAHGPELCIKLSSFATVLDMQDEVDTAWIILGDHEGKRIVYTAHPGPLMMPLPREEGEISIQDMYDAKLPVAVKVI